MELGNSKKLQAPGDFATEERGGMFQGSDGLRDVCTFVHSDADQGMLLVGGYLNTRYSGGSDTRV